MASNDLAPPASERGTTPVSTLVLMGASVVAVLSVIFAPAGLPALVLAVIAFVRRDTDPAGTRRLTRIGWAVLLVVAAVTVMVLVLLVVLLAVNGFS